MSNQTVFGRHIALLKQTLHDYKVAEVEWTDAEEVFIANLELLPFDIQILQCLKGNDFTEVKGVGESFGHEPSRFNIESFYWNVHPEDLEDVIQTDIRMIKWLKSARVGLVKKTLLTAQFRFADSAGHYHLVNRNTFIIKLDSAGNAAGLFHLFVDVTDTEQFGRVKYRFQYPGKRKTVKKGQKSLGIELTKREEEVLRLIVKGYSSMEISSKLFISRETVYRHRKNMIKKTNAKNTKSLAMRAIAENWV